MTKKFVGILMIIAVLFMGCQKEEFEVSQQDLKIENGQIIPGQYIVVFKTSSVQKVAAVGTYADRVKSVREYAVDMLKGYNVSEEKISATYGRAIKGFAAELNADKVEMLRNDERIAYIEPDRVVTLDYTINAKPGGGTAPAQSIPWGITRIGGAVAYTGTGVAWIIDSGIDLDHPDLNVDLALSKTFVANTTSADDQNGHGTHVAGTVAAKNNTIGVVGVAAGAKVVAVRVLDRRGSGAYSGVIAGVDYVAANGKTGDVANMSLGGPVSDALDAAVIAAAGKGIKFALAAGNESTHANNSSPGRVNHTNVYTISAMDSKDVWAYFSNYGNPPVDYCAPGVSIYSTYKGGVYSTLSGTSMASPHACGVLLLGAARTDGYVSGDPDGNADPIIHR
ncbi:MAG: S8 family serine peptidase [Tenuifilaceae bacterium]